MNAKHSILIALCLLCSSAASAQSKLFDKYAGMDNVTSVYISNAMFNMMPVIGDIGLSLTNLKGKVESLQLVSSEQQEPHVRQSLLIGAVQSSAGSNWGIKIL